MSDNPVDPSGNTEAFRVFAQAPEPMTESPSRTPLIVVGAVVAVVVLAIIAWVALG
jgi:hypothetical protein